MSALTISQKLCIDASKTIKQLCNYLLQKTPITSFSVNREFFDGRRITLTTRGDWTENYFTMDYFKRLDGYEMFYENEITIWHPFGNESIIKDARENFNICDGVTLSYFENNYVDLYHFASSSNDNDMTNWYANNITHLKEFTRYIRENFDANFKHLSPYDAIEKECFTKYAAMMKKQKAVVLAPYELIKNTDRKIPPISKRELQILGQLVQGNTAKEAARALLISPKTIEYHILKLREKFNCQSKSQLIRLALAKGLLGQP